MYIYCPECTLSYITSNSIRTYEYDSVNVYISIYRKPINTKHDNVRVYMSLFLYLQISVIDIFTQLCLDKEKHSTTTILALLCLLNLCSIILVFDCMDLKQTVRINRIIIRSTTFLFRWRSFPYIRFARFCFI